MEFRRVCFRAMRGTFATCQPFLRVFQVATLIRVISYENSDQSSLDRLSFDVDNKL